MQNREIYGRFISGWVVKDGHVCVCAWCWPGDTVRSVMRTTLTSPDRAPRKLGLIKLPISHGICDFHRWLMEWEMALNRAFATGEFPAISG